MSTDFIYMFTCDCYSKQLFFSRLYSIRRLCFRILRNCVLCEVQHDCRYKVHALIHRCHYLWWYYKKRNFVFYSV